MRQQRRRKYPETLAEIAVEVTRLRMEAGDEEQKAMAFGFEVAEVIRRRWGGVQIYIPRGTDFFLSKRDREIIEEFDGTNRRELCSKYGITVRRFYQIINSDRAGKVVGSRPIDMKERDSL